MPVDLLIVRRTSDTTPTLAWFETKTMALRDQFLHCLAMGAPPMPDGHPTYFRQPGPRRFAGRSSTTNFLLPAARWLNRRRQDLSSSPNVTGMEGNASRTLVRQRYTLLDKSQEHTEFPGGPTSVALRIRSAAIPPPMRYTTEQMMYPDQLRTARGNISIRTRVTLCGETGGHASDSELRRLWCCSQ
jgi:hypothetical protein